MSNTWPALTFVDALKAGSVTINLGRVDGSALISTLELQMRADLYKNIVEPATVTLADIALGIFSVKYNKPMADLRLQRPQDGSGTLLPWGSTMNLDRIPLIHQPEVASRAYLNAVRAYADGKKTMQELRVLVGRCLEEGKLPVPRTDEMDADGQYLATDVIKLKSSIV